MPSITESQVLEAQRRAESSWEADGLQSIVLSFPLTLLGILLVLMVFKVIHFHKDRYGYLDDRGVLWAWAMGIAYVFFLFVLAGHREIVKWLKSRITYPRTGYVGLDDWVPPRDGQDEWDWTIESDPLSGRRFTGLSLNKPVGPAVTQDQAEESVPRKAAVAGHFRSAATFLSRLLWMSLPVINALWGRTAYQAAAPWIFATASMLMAIGWKRSNTRKTAWAEQLVLASAGIIILVWPAARNHWMEIFALMCLGGGILLLSSGVIALLRYLRRNPVVQA